MCGSDDDDEYSIVETSFDLGTSING